MFRCRETCVPAYGTRVCRGSCLFTDRDYSNCEWIGYFDTVRIRFLTVVQRGIFSRLSTKNGNKNGSRVFSCSDGVS